MRILIVTQYFWPEEFRINDLALALKERGHEVAVLTGIPSYPTRRCFPGYRSLLWRQEDYHGIVVKRFPLLSRGSGRNKRLILNYLSFVFFALLSLPFYCRDHYDIIFVFQTSPITVALPAIWLKKLKRIPLLMWVQDIWPESLIATSAIKSPFILRQVGRMVRFIYRRCDKILIQARGMCAAVLQYGAARKKIVYFPNWAETLYQSLTIDHKRIQQLGFPYGFCVLFAGNIGAAQSFTTILTAAQHLQSYPDIHWVIIGTGRQVVWVQQQIKNMALKNIYLLGQKPIEAMPEYFAAADALLVTLRRSSIFALTIPSKIQSYLACGKPIIAALDGEGAEIIQQSGAGFVSAAEDANHLAANVLRLYRLSSEERKALGLAGLRYSRQHFEREKLVSYLETVLQTVHEESNEAVSDGGDGMLGHAFLLGLRHLYNVKVTLRQAASAYKKFALFKEDNSFFNIDVRNFADIQQVIREFCPEVVINCVGLVKQRLLASDTIASIEINALFPQRLALFCKSLAIRLITFSTDCVFAGTRGSYTEGDVTDAQDLYGRTKYLGEVHDDCCLTIRSSIIGLELANFTNLISWFLRQQGVITGFRRAIYTGFTTFEMVRIVEYVLQRHPLLQGLWHVASSPISKYHLLCMLKEKLGREDITICPEDAFSCDRSLQGQRFSQVTGYYAPTWEKMLDELVQQIKQRAIV